ncbi:hypothetical protein DFJ73DRAFT_920015 [Zopfochytrium polystomum]|nr:hypothetical protein DFJ73DRAFT_920015 [Zopfochytrium polystomum]
MQLRTRSASAALAAAALLIHSLVVALAAPPSSPHLYSHQTSATYTGIARSLSPPICIAGSIGARHGSDHRGSLGVAGAMGGKQLAEVRVGEDLPLCIIETERRPRTLLRRDSRNEYERDKDKENKRINHYEAKPGNGCYTVCGGKKTHTLVRPTAARASSALSAPSSGAPSSTCSRTRDAWDDSDLAAADEAVDVDYASKMRLKRARCPSQKPAPFPYQKKTLERTSTPRRSGAAAPAAGGAASESSANTAEASAKAPAARRRKGSWNPSRRRLPNPDEIKHVTVVGGGLLGKFQLANKMRVAGRKTRSTRTSTRAGALSCTTRSTGSTGL